MKKAITILSPALAYIALRLAGVPQPVMYWVVFVGIVVGSLIYFFTRK